MGDNVEMEQSWDRVRAGDRAALGWSLEEIRMGLGWGPDRMIWPYISWSGRSVMV